MMRGLAAAVTIGLIGTIAGAEAAEQRCGWLSNPTPANWFLDDGEGSWTIQAQGSEGAEGQDLIYDISAGPYVRTNGNYGYACACMRVETDGDESIRRILSFRQLPLAKCQNDPALRAPE